MTVPSIIQTGLYEQEPRHIDAGAVKTTWKTDDHIIQVPRVGESHRIALNSHLYDVFSDTAVPVPDVVASSGTPPAYSVYEYISEPDLGTVLKQVNKETEMDLIREAGAVLGAIHEPEMENYGFPGQDDPTKGTYQRWDRFMDEHIQHALERIAPVIDKETRSYISSQVDASNLPEHPPSRVNHDDFHPGNILGDEDGITAVLDFDNAIYGDPRYDHQRAKGMIGGLTDPGDTYDTDRIEAFDRGYRKTASEDIDERLEAIYDLAARTKWTDAMMYHYKEGNIERSVIETHGQSLDNYVSNHRE
ncbi:MAG: aminoglycoside phosphotransferase family protein [Candidatus Nanohaloarchaeota archaeon QJJ-5]|nr:aminoglycoside phosphotransferase family protein [Candidatus Nanohaloarchaeota archaeon QJJ-5]